MKSEQNNFHLGMSVADNAGCLDAIDARHGDVHQDYFWLEFIGKEDGFVAIACFAAKLPFGKRLQDGLDTSANESMVINDQDTGHRAIFSWSRRGETAARGQRVNCFESFGST